MARVIVSRRAERDLQDLAEAVREAASGAITQLGIDPEAAGKELRGRLSGLWVCRIGNYRILYRIEGEPPRRRVILLSVVHRAIAYRRRRKR